MFLHISENVNFDTTYIFLFFGFLSLCYGRGDAAGFIPFGFQAAVGSDEAFRE